MFIVYVVESWTILEAGEITAFWIILAVVIVRVNPEFKKLIFDEGPKVYMEKEVDGFSEGGFRILPKVIVTGRVVWSVAKQELILIFWELGNETEQELVLKEALFRVGDSGVIVEGKVISIYPPAGIGSKRVKAKL